MSKQYEELIVNLANEMHQKQLKYMELDRIDPEQLPREEFRIFIAEYELAQAELRRACIFLSSVKRSLLDSISGSAVASIPPFYTPNR